MNYKDPVYILIILALGFFLWGQCESGKRKDLEREQGEILHREQVAAKEAEIRTLADSISTQKQKAAKDRGRDSVAIAGLKQGNFRMSRKLAELRIPIEVIADTLQPLRDYLVLADSLSAAKDSLIVDMGLRHSAQIVDLNEIIEKQGRQIVKEREIAESWRLAAVESEKDVKKERRKKGFWRTTTAILAGGVIFLSLQQ